MEKIKSENVQIPDIQTVIDLVGEEKSSMLLSQFVNGLRYLSSFDKFNPNEPLIMCLHGNSSCAETFSKILILARNKIQMVAVDLPGCGQSKRLPEYSMQSVANEIDELIEYFNPLKLYLVGHSLGGHLCGFISRIPMGVILIGTPPLSSVEDFAKAFIRDEKSKQVVSLLGKSENFTQTEAKLFVSHTGVKDELLNIMIDYAMKTDGLFRSGCLSTLVTVDQVKWLKNIKNMNINIILIHGTDDGVINKTYLLNLLEKNIVNDVLLLKGPHMLPVTNSKEVFSIIIEHMHC